MKTIESEEQYIAIFNGINYQIDSLNKGVSQFQKKEKTQMVLENNIIKIRDKDNNPVAELHLDNNWVLAKLKENITAAETEKQSLNELYITFLQNKLV